MQLKDKNIETKLEELNELILNKNNEMVSLIKYSAELENEYRRILKSGKCNGSHSKLFAVRNKLKSILLKNKKSQK